MPGWLFWTFVALASWFAVSFVVALLIGNLIGRGREPGRRVVVLAGPVSMRVRVRRGRGLRKAS
jgi:hypothetical protein